MRSTSVESKKTVECGICVPAYRARRDYLQTVHFPKKHKGMGYIEKGERKITFGVKFGGTNPKSTEETGSVETPPIEIDEETLQEIETPNTDGDKGDLKTQAHTDADEVKGDLKTPTGTTNDDLMKQIVELKEMLRKKTNFKLAPDTDPDPTSDLKEKLDLIQSAETITELCMRAGLSTFENQGKVMCDVCTHDDLTEADEGIRRLGVFSYDIIKFGADFKEKSQPREFRNLKKVLIAHNSSNYHMKMNKDLLEKHMKDEKDETYNYAVGMGRARQIYQNVKNKCSFLKYESDCLVAALNNEDIGNVNHSWMFAQDVVNQIAVSIQTDLKTHFRTPLACTGQLPPVGLATDKMTQKRHTNHLAAFLTPDVESPLSDSFLKPVYVGMPVVDKHGGRDIAEQMLKIAETYLDDLGEQLQAFNNDGQYFGLNVAKHIFELREHLTKKKNFIMFNWDPSHRNALADKDARKEQKQERSYFNDVLETVQWIFKNVGYGKHFEEYLAICKELNIDPRAPILFSDTRFPQFSYNTLRNFLQVYVGLLKQLKSEDATKNGKDAGVSAALRKMKTKAFVITLAGATDIYRREQILSQQCQKIDQHIYEVYDNLKLQKEKLEEMLKNLTEGTVFSDWTMSDVNELDNHLWANLSATCKDIFENTTFRGETLEDYSKRPRVTRQTTLEEFATVSEGGVCSPGVVKALKEIASYNKGLIDALEERFGDDFEDPFVLEIKDLLDFNFMLGFAHTMEDNTDTYDNCLATVKAHGIDSLRKIVARQDSDKEIDEAELTKLEEEYFKFKRFALDLIANVNITKEKQAIKAAAISESEVCLKCHRRFEISEIKKHIETVHKGAVYAQAQDRLVRFSSVKVLHGVCKLEKYYIDQQKFISLALKLLCKTPNEAVVESLGSVLQKHMKPERSAKQSSFDSELHIDWNGPVVTKADSLLERSLDKKFGSRKRWNFKVGDSKFYTSKVVDRKKAETSRLSFLNK